MWSYSPTKQQHSWTRMKYDKGIVISILMAYNDWGNGQKTNHNPQRQQHKSCSLSVKLKPFASTTPG